MDWIQWISESQLIEMVINLARETLSIGKCSAVVVLDVRNTFNSANWVWVKHALAKLGVLDYSPW